MENEIYQPIELDEAEDTEEPDVDVFGALYFEPGGEA